MTLPCRTSPGTAQEGRQGNPSSHSNSNSSTTSSGHTWRTEGFLPPPRTPNTITTASCPEAADPGLQNQLERGRPAGCHPPSLGVTPKPPAHRWALPGIKTCLWFIVSNFPSPPLRKGGSIASGILPTEKSLFERGICAMLWRQSQPRELHVPRAWASTFNLPGEKEKKPKQTHLANTSGWRGNGKAATAACRCSRSSPPAFLLWLGSKEKHYESRHLNFTLSHKKPIPELFLRKVI